MKSGRTVNAIVVALLLQSTDALASSQVIRWKLIDGPWGTTPLIALLATARSVAALTATQRFEFDNRRWAADPTYEPLDGGDTIRGLRAAPMFAHVPGDDAIWAEFGSSTFRWKHGRWTEAPGINRELLGWSFASPESGWAVASFGFMFRWDGRTFTRETNPAIETGTAVGLISFGHVRDEVWLRSTSGSLLSFDGARWKSRGTLPTRQQPRPWVSPVCATPNDGLLVPGAPTFVRVGGDWRTTEQFGDTTACTSDGAACWVANTKGRVFTCAGKEEASMATEPIRALVAAGGAAFALAGGRLYQRAVDERVWFRDRSAGSIAADEGDASAALSIDYDRDGDNDLIVFNWSREPHVFENQGDWRFVDATGQANLPTRLDSVRGAVKCDLDGNGYDDLLVRGGEKGAPSQQFYLRNIAGRFVDAGATGGFETAEPDTAPLGTERASIVCVDIDQDGDLDVYVSRFDDPAQQPTPNVLYENDGQGRLQLRRLPARGIGGTGWSTGAVFGRFSGSDGLDLVIANMWRTGHELWLREPTGRYRNDFSGAPGHEHSRALGVYSADFDGNGFDDIVFVQRSWPSKFWAAHEGGFSIATNAPAVAAASSGAIADFDGDGHADFMTNAPEVFLNRGDWRFDRIEAQGAAAVAGTILVVDDLDGDGDPDVYAARDGPNVLLENRADSSTASASRVAMMGASHVLQPVLRRLAWSSASLRVALGVSLLLAFILLVWARVEGATPLRNPAVALITGLAPAVGALAIPESSPAWSWLVLVGGAVAMATLVVLRVVAARETRRRRIGQHTLKRHLGGGGMGDVWLAVADDGREVAIKVLRPKLASDPIGVERFEQAAGLAARANHVNVARVFDVHVESEFREGAAARAWLAMEYVDGVALSDVMAGEVTVGQSCAIAVQLCRGLAALHAVDVIHRDIKPDNILISEAGVLKIVDFGLARAFGARTLTQTGAALGTMRYIAPEQLVDPHAADERADVWAVGVVVYELLSGQHPCAPDSHGQTSSEIAYRVMKAVSDGVVRPLTEAAPDVDVALAGIVDRALKVNPGERWRDATALGDAFAQFADETIEARRPQSTLRATSIAFVMSAMLAIGCADATRTWMAPAVVGEPHPVVTLRPYEVIESSRRVLGAAVGADASWVYFTGNGVLLPSGVEVATPGMATRGVWCGGALWVADGPSGLAKVDGERVQSYAVGDIRDVVCAASGRMIAADHRGRVLLLSPPEVVASVVLDGAPSAIAMTGRHVAVALEDGGAALVEIGSDGMSVDGMSLVWTRKDTGRVPAVAARRDGTLAWLGQPGRLLTWRAGSTRLRRGLPLRGARLAADGTTGWWAASPETLWRIDATEHGGTTEDDVVQFVEREDATWVVDQSGRVRRAGAERDAVIADPVMSYSSVQGGFVLSTSASKAVVRHIETKRRFEIAPTPLRLQPAPLGVVVAADEGIRVFEARSGEIVGAEAKTGSFNGALITQPNLLWAARRERGLERQGVLLSHRLDCPDWASIAYGPGVVAVACAKGGWVEVFDEQGRHLRSIATSGRIVDLAFAQGVLLVSLSHWGVEAHRIDGGGDTDRVVLPGEPGGIAVRGDEVAIAIGTAGVAVLRTNPQGTLRLIEILQTPGNAQDVDFDGDALLAADTYSVLRLPRTK